MQKLVRLSVYPHSTRYSWPSIYIMWHADTLLGDGCEIGEYMTAVTGQRLANNRRVVFPAQSAN
jgi:hypothetical protein